MYDDLQVSQAVVWQLAWVIQPRSKVSIYEAVPGYGNVGQCLAMHANAIRAVENRP